MLKLIRSLMSWTLATVVVCACIAGFYYFHRGDEELRHRIEQTLTSHYPDLSISVGAARYIQGEGIQLRKVAIVQPATKGRTARSEVAYVDEATLYCSPTLDQLLHANVDISRVRLRGLAVYPTRSRDGTWNVANLVPKEATDRPMPTIAIEDARVELIDRFYDQPTVVAFHDIKADITPPQLSVEKDNRITITSEFNNEHFNAANITVKIDPATQVWQATGSVNGLNADANLFRKLLPSTTKKQPASGSTAAIDGFSGVANLDFSAAKGPQEPTPRFHITGQLLNGRFDAPRFLANPITDISAEWIEVIKDSETVGWQILDVNANYGRSPIHFDFVRSSSLSKDCDLQVAGNAKNVTVTRNLVKILSPRLQEIWSKYEFLGPVDANGFDVRRIAGTWSVDADVKCLDVSINSAYFPYPVHRTQGEITYRHNRLLKADLWSTAQQSANRTPVKINAEIQNPGANYSGKIVVQSRDWLQLDQQLRNALGPSVRKILNDVEARGEVNFKAVLTRNQQTLGKLAKDIVIDVRNAGAKYVDFPYPLQISKGRIHVTDDIWTFRNFEAKNDSCVVRATGNWVPANGRSLPNAAAIATSVRNAGELDIEFIATDIPCDAELREALPAGPKQIWESLHPTGHVDYAKIDLLHRTDMPKPKINILVKQLPRDDGINRGLELQPTWFPLQLSRVTGIVDYKDDGTFKTKIRAEHGSRQRSVSLSSDGGGIFREDGTWEVHLNRIHADGIESTPEITAALPKDLADAIRSLQFRGKMSVSKGEMHFAGNSEPNSFVNSTWRSLIDIDNGLLVVGGHTVENIFGQINVSGEQSRSGTTNWGRATCASLMCKGIQVTDADTLWQMDQQRLLFGGGAANLLSPLGIEGPTHLTAKMFGGAANVDGEVRFDENYPWQFNAALSQFNVATLARDLAMQSTITGLGDAGIQMRGNASGMHTWNGNGSVQLRNANLAKLPALISLVNAMKVRTARPDVFTASDIEFNIDGPYVNLQKFDLHGESFSLKGQGWIAMDRRINLAFHALPGGENSIMPFLRKFAGKASKQWLQILVTGTVDKMNWDTKPVPALSDFFLEQARQPLQQR